MGKRPFQRATCLVQLLRLHLATRALAGSEHRIGRLAEILLQAIGELIGAGGVADRFGRLRLLVQLSGGRPIAGLVIAPLLPAEDADQTDRDTDDDRHAVLAQPLLYAFALFVIVVCVKCHAITVERPAGPRVGPVPGLCRERRNARGARSIREHNRNPPSNGSAPERALRAIRHPTQAPRGTTLPSSRSRRKWATLARR